MTRPLSNGPTGRQKLLVGATIVILLATILGTVAGLPSAATGFLGFSVGLLISYATGWADQGQSPTLLAPVLFVVALVATIACIPLVLNVGDPSDVDRDLALLAVSTGIPTLVSMGRSLVLHSGPLARPSWRDLVAPVIFLVLGVPLALGLIALLAFVGFF